MLVLHRTVGTAVIVNDNIIIRILKVDRTSGQVKLGIEAPSEVKIIREEIKDRADEQRNGT